MPGHWRQARVVGILHLSLFGLFKPAGLLAQLFAVFVVAVAIPGQVLALPDSNSIVFNNCDLTLPGSTWTAPARCGWLEVAENPEAPAGRRIKLHIALVPAAQRGAAADPLFLFAGGPGQAAGESYVMLQEVLSDIRDHRDIVLIDQRGTGRSHPLDCTTPEDESLEQSIDLAVVREQTIACLDALDADPRFYTTTIAMQDYELVRQAMGYESINLLGISYGTRAAQVYLRQYPQRVRSMILDSVVPMSLILGTEHAAMLDRAVEAIFSDCAADTDCRERYPAAKSELDDLIQTLRKAPRTTSFIHPVTGEREELEISADILAVAIRFLSYRSESQATLPLLINEAVTRGELQRLAAQALMIMSGLSEQISSGMELSVICSEDLPFMTGEIDAGDSLLGNTLLEVMQTQCAVWPRGDIPAAFHDPVEVDVPVLLMSGSRDPVTPPQYAAEAATQFPRHANLVGRGLGHAVISNHCMRGLATRFVETADADGLDTRCVDRIEPAPFFTTLLGPSP